eukprot:195120-Alexandrium_andersonii.AAC.1
MAALVMTFLSKRLPKASQVPRMLYGACHSSGVSLHAKRRQSLTCSLGGASTSRAERERNIGERKAGEQ